MNRPAQSRDLQRARGTPTDALLRVLTINTHKGLTAWNRRHVLKELRDAVRSTAADLVFLQEVIGERSDTSPFDGPHYEYLADSIWPAFAYGRNAVYPRGHHGNALLSRRPIVRWRNHDASIAGPEPRGLLHCEISSEDQKPLHAICVHLGLRERDRLRQLEQLCVVVGEHVPADAALLVAGDFNDWRGRADPVLEQHTGLRSAFALAGLEPARTFPARWPLFCLDRVYVRGLQVRSACALSARPWPHLSDHLPLLVEVTK